MAARTDPPALTLRLSTPADLAAVDRLLERSYLRLLAADYPPSVMVTAVPRLARARPELLASGRYWLLWDGARLMAAGGFSLEQPRPGAGGGLTAHVRHVATDPDAVRQGIGRRLLTHVIHEARATGADRIETLSTRTAVPFYRALGFRALGELAVELAPAISFPVVRMHRQL